jgi:hypothetical protein
MKLKIIEICNLYDSISYIELLRIPWCMLFSWYVEGGYEEDVLWTGNLGYSGEQGFQEFCFGNSEDLRTCKSEFGM